ncbi:hypothetical protein B2D07_02540 [Desulfococcus multivorans]|uniref:Uncharacterized protein n=2 Tax=Desulfococcus multivorans TaxID=897 RepID=S7UHF2_DESML|nr:hypothetical protein B2D07_02540 [Desulfococcus multivorans]EPR33264.1 hypothetical protein dsmv_3520 [Desulfococcus multivorans DSM 2059]SKA21839.1 hypothetical protein SAMN02745446_03331 [Desulfococcus multivorans DSM 2059]
MNLPGQIDLIINGYRMKMSADTRIIILGTFHPLQCGSTECTKEQIQDYRQFLEQICINSGIQCIVEEMNDEGLKNHEVENTIAFSTCKHLNIKHQYADLSSEHLADLCLFIDCFMFREPTNESKSHKRELLHQHLLNPIRERYWLANVLALNIWPALLICGSDHVKSMINLIKVLEYGPVESIIKC